MPRPILEPMGFNMPISLPQESATTRLASRLRASSQRWLYRWDGLPPDGAQPDLVRSKQERHSKYTAQPTILFARADSDGLRRYLLLQGAWEHLERQLSAGFISGLMRLELCAPVDGTTAAGRIKPSPERLALELSGHACSRAWSDAWQSLGTAWVVAGLSAANLPSRRGWHLAVSLFHQRYLLHRRLLAATLQAWGGDTDRTPEAEAFQEAHQQALQYFSGAIERDIAQSASALLEVTRASPPPWDCKPWLDDTTRALQQSLRLGMNRLEQAWTGRR